MAKRQFTDEERYAVYTIHGEKCYMCGKPLDLLSMEVDHILPENLLEDSERLSSIFAQFGLPTDFDLQSFDNWMPSCRRCNNRKRARIFEPTPIIQIELQKAAEKALQVARLATKIVSSKEALKAWDIIKRSETAGNLPDTIRTAILEFASFHTPNRVPEVAAEPIHLTPLIEVISEENGVRMVKGPYGIGSGPVGPNVHSSFRCGVCGFSAWNGARCVVCGDLSDD